MTRTRIPALLLAAAALLWASPASAYVRSKVPGGSACLWWGSRDVPYQVNYEGSDDLDDGSDFTAVADGYGAWSELGCSDLYLRPQGQSTRADVGYDEMTTANNNLVVFREAHCEDVVPAGDRCWSCFDDGGPCCSSQYGCWEHPSGVIAVTTTTFSRSTGQLVDADIEMNGADFWFTTVEGPPCDDPVSPQRCSGPVDCETDERCHEGRCLRADCARTDIANTITHEVGHVVGLDHSPVRDSTMYASAPPGEVSKRSLEDDDRQGLCDIYPEAGPTLTCFGDVVDIEPVSYDENTRGCGGCAGGPGTAGLGGLALALLSLVRRRRGPLARRRGR